MLADPDTTVRWHACGCLHDFGDERAVPCAREVLGRDPDPQVRGTAAYALGGIGSPAAIPSLLAVLGSDNEYDIHGHSPSSCAATALDDILGTHETAHPDGRRPVPDGRASRTWIGSGVWRRSCSSDGQAVAPELRRRDNQVDEGLPFLTHATGG